MSKIISYLTSPIVLSAAIGAVAYHVTSSTGGLTNPDTGLAEQPIVDPLIAGSASAVIAYYMLSGVGGGGSGSSEFLSSDYSLTNMGF